VECGREQERRASGGKGKSQFHETPRSLRRGGDRQRLADEGARGYCARTAHCDRSQRGRWNLNLCFMNIQRTNSGLPSK
jgi:hypothetical protein